jgi:YbbR domain-containing protein
MLHRNLGLKLVAFALAVALWGWVLVNQRTVASARTVPVVVRTVGAPPASISIRSVQVIPPVVTIAGAEDEVSDVRAVETADLPLDRLTSDTTQELSLVVPKGIRLLRDTEVKVTVRVEQEAPGAQEPSR